MPTSVLSRPRSALTWIDLPTVSIAHDHVATLRTRRLGIMILLLARSVISHE
jgi:hypothetical protein